MQSWLVVLGLVVICSWPWLMAYRAAGKASARPGAFLFALASVAAAGFAYPAISRAPAEGVGYYVIFFLLFVWLSCPLLLKIKSSEPSE